MSEPMKLCVARDGETWELFLVPYDRLPPFAAFDLELRLPDVRPGAEWPHDRTWNARPRRPTRPQERRAEGRQSEETRSERPEERRPERPDPGRDGPTPGR